MRDRPSAHSESHLDEAAVRAFVAGLERAFNSHDAGALHARSTADVVWTTPSGSTHHGHSAVHGAAAAALGGPLNGAHARYEVAAMRALAPDAIFVQVRQTPTTPAGEPLPDAAGSLAALVLVRRDGEWWLAAGQNTVVTPG